MADNNETPKIEEFELAPAKITREFLGAGKRDSEGNALFPKLGHELTLRVVALEPFKKKDKVQPALVLEDSEGREWFRPLGPQNQQEIAALGFTKAGDLVKKKITFRSYHTGNTGQFEIGLEVVRIE